MTKTEKKRLISKIAVASGVAKYAIEDRITKEKISDDDLIILSQNLDILKLLKPANDYNRHCQGKKTEEANAKLKEFMNPDNSEIINFGKWLFSALDKKGEERKEHLLEKDLVHKEDYNKSITDLTDVIDEQDKGFNQQAEYDTKIIAQLENKIDSLRQQLLLVSQYIINNYGQNKWNDIRTIIHAQKDLTDFQQIKQNIQENKAIIINHFGLEKWQTIKAYFLIEENNNDEQKYG